MYTGKKSEAYQTFYAEYWPWRTARILCDANHNTSGQTQTNATSIYKMHHQYQLTGQILTIPCF
jgi:hypothetical protein